MPQKLYDDEWTETWQGDNGQVLTVAKPVAQKLFGGMGQQDWDTGHLPPSAAETPMPGVSNDVPVPPSATPPGAAPLPPPSPDVSPPGLRPSTLAEGPQPTAQVVEQPAPAGELVPSAEPPRISPAGAATLEQAPDQEPREAAPGLGRAYQRQAEAARAATEAESLGQQEIANAYSLANAEVKQIEDRAAAQRAADEADINARRQAYDKNIKAWNDANPDRSRWWDTRSGGKKFAAILGVALSGLGMALKGRGGENPALDMIMGAINQDVADQQAQIAKKGQALQMEKGAIGDAIEDAQRRTADLAMQRAQRIDGVKRHIEQIVAATNSEKVKANGLQIMGQLEAQYTHAVNEAANTAWEQGFRERQFDEQQRARRQAAYQQAQARKDADRRHQQEMQYKYDALNASRDADSRKYEAEASEKARQGAIVNPYTGKVIGTNRFGGKQNVTDTETLADITELHDMLAKYESRVRKAGAMYKGGDSAKWMQSTEAADLTSMHKELSRKVGKLVNSGAFTDKDAEDFEKIVPGPETWTQRSDPAVTVRRMRERYINQVGRFLKTRGVDPSPIQQGMRSYYKNESAQESKDTVSDDVLGILAKPPTGAPKAYTMAVGAALKGAKEGNRRMFDALKQSTRQSGPYGEYAKNAFVEYAFHAAQQGSDEYRDLLETIAGGSKNYANQAGRARAYLNKLGAK